MHPWKSGMYKLIPLLFKYTAGKTLSYSINTFQDLKLAKPFELREGEKKLTFIRAPAYAYFLFYSPQTTLSERNYPHLPHGNLIVGKLIQLLSDGWGMPTQTFRLKHYAHSIPRTALWLSIQSHCIPSPKEQTGTHGNTSDLWFNILPTTLLGLVRFCNWH